MKKPEVQIYFGRTQRIILNIVIDNTGDKIIASLEKFKDSHFNRKHFAYNVLSYLSCLYIY